MDTLTAIKPRYMTFIQAYTAVGQETYQNITKSAIMAGYDANSACKSGKRLLEMPEIGNEVQRRLEAIRQEMENASSMTREEMTKLSKEYMRECGAKNPNAPRWADIICKINGLYQDTVNNTLAVFMPNEENVKLLKGKISNIIDASATSSS